MVETLLLDNEHVRVTEITLAPGQTHKAGPRMPRVVIAMTDNRTHRRSKSEATLLYRSAGSAVWRDASDGHEVEHLGQEEHSTIIVEIKTP